MSKIAQHLRMLASAARVSMENDQVIDTPPAGEIEDGELEAVAAKAAEEVDAAAVDAADGEAAATTETAESEAAAVVEEVSATDTPAEAGESAEVPVATEETPAADEAATEQAAAEEVADIQTPAEEDLETEIQAQAEANADEQAAQIEAELAGDEVAADTTETPAIETPAAPEAAVAEEVPAVTEDATVAETPEIPVEPEAPAAEVSDEAPVVAEEISADAAPAETVEAAPAETAPVAEEPAPAQEEAPAAPPGPQSETSEAVQEVVNLTEALASAHTAEEVLQKAREVSEGLEEAVGVAEHLNEQGGVSVESYSLLHLSLRPHLAELERSDINLGVSFESFSEDPKARVKVSVEEIHELIQEMDLAKPVLERQAIEALDRTVSALKDAIPSACQRLKAVISQASVAGDQQGGGQVDVSDGLANALAFDGQIPEDLAGELQLYAMMGRVLLGEYSEKAFAGARSASLINNAVSFDSTSAFWEKVGTAVDGVCDPRCVLGDANLMMTLPGGGRLFGERGREVQSVNETLRKIMEYTTHHAPLETSVIPPFTGEATTYPAFPASKIVMVGHALQEVLDCEHICARLEEGQKLWPEAADATRFLEETLGNAPDSLDYTATQHFPMVVKFVETSYSLATWPLINYLANLVLTVNAFVLFAERSLQAEPAPVEPVAEVAPTPVEEAAPTAEAEIPEIPEIDAASAADEVIE